MAARVKALVKPEALVWTRTSAGFSVPGAAHRLKIDEDKLTSWETGEDGFLVFQANQFTTMEASGFAIAEERLPVAEVIWLMQTPTAYRGGAEPHRRTQPTAFDPNLP